MRLIDADALIEELHHMIEGDADLRKDYEYMGIDDCIRSMPTAYDVDAVVAELEKERMRYFLTIANGSDKNMNLAYCKISNAIDKTIEIVRKGGAE